MEPVIFLVRLKIRDKKFIFISTVEAAGYGDGIHPRTEDDPPKPDNNYGKSKLEAEKLVLSEQWTFKKLYYACQ